MHLHSTHDINFVQLIYCLIDCLIVHLILPLNAYLPVLELLSLDIHIFQDNILGVFSTWLPSFPRQTFNHFNAIALNSAFVSLMSGLITLENRTLEMALAG